MKSWDMSLHPPYHYLSASALVTQIWEIMFYFEEEIKYIWPMPWTWTKCVFFSNRYGALAAQSAFLYQSIASQSITFSSAACYKWSIMRYIMPTIFGLPFQGILVARICALYNEQKSIKRAVLIIFVLEILGSLVIWGIDLPKPRNFDPWCNMLNASDFKITLFIVASIPFPLDFIMLTLALKKGFQLSPSFSQTFPMLRVMFFDWLWAYSIITVTVAVFVSLLLTSQFMVIPPLASWIITSISVMSSRLILDVAQFGNHRPIEETFVPTFTDHVTLELVGLSRSTPFHEREDWRTRP